MKKDGRLVDLPQHIIIPLRHVRILTATRISTFDMIKSWAMISEYAPAHRNHHEELGTQTKFIYAGSNRSNLARQHPESRAHQLNTTTHNNKQRCKPRNRQRDRLVYLGIGKQAIGRPRGESRERMQATRRRRQGGEHPVEVLGFGFIGSLERSLRRMISVTLACRLPLIAGACVGRLDLGQGRVQVLSPIDDVIACMRQAIRSNRRHAQEPELQLCRWRPRAEERTFRMRIPASWLDNMTWEWAAFSIWSGKKLDECKDGVCVVVE
jgi:hypothetical protein